MSPTYQFFSQLAETWVLIYFFVLFVAVLVYALWPSRQKQFDEAARMPRGRFHFYTFAGSWPWCWVLAYIGLKLGERWDSDSRLKLWFHRLDAVIVVVLLLGIAWFIRSHVRNRIRNEKIAPVE